MNTLVQKALDSPLRENLESIPIGEAVYFHPKSRDFHAYFGVSGGIKKHQKINHNPDKYVNSFCISILLEFKYDPAFKLWIPNGISDYGKQSLWSGVSFNIPDDFSDIEYVYKLPNIKRMMKEKNNPNFALSSRIINILSLVQ